MKKLIVTMVFRDVYKAFSEITFPLIEKYAKKCGADIEIVSPWKEYRDNRSQLKLYSCLERYDRVMFVDIDCVVSEDTPNLFDIVPYGSIGIRRYPHIDGHLELFTGKKKYQSTKVLKFDYPNYVFYNCGFYLLDKTHLPIVRKFTDKIIHKFLNINDELIISDAINNHKTDVYELDKSICFHYTNPLETLMDLINFDHVDGKTLCDFADLVFDEDQVFANNKGYENSHIIHMMLGPKNYHFIKMAESFRDKKSPNEIIKKYCEEIRNYINANLKYIISDIEVFGSDDIIKQRMQNF